MRVSFDFLSEPIKISDEYINVICIENQNVFRNVVSNLHSEEPENLNIIFSENFTPIKFKGSVCFVENVFDLNYSNSVIKKLYEQIEKYCNNFLQSETVTLKTNIINYFDFIVKAFDYDLEYSYDIELSNLFKIQGLKPYTDSNSFLENLINYIKFIQNYTPVKCFILLNIHLYLSNEELELFYRDIINNHIKLLVLENYKFFDRHSFEKIIILDKDLCEIVENN